MHVPAAQVNPSAQSPSTVQLDLQPLDAVASQANGVQGFGSGSALRMALPALGHRRGQSAFVPLRVGRASQDRGLSGTVRPGSARAQEPGGASGLRPESAGRIALAGGIREATRRTESNCPADASHCDGTRRHLARRERGKAAGFRWRSWDNLTHRQPPKPSSEQLPDGPIRELPDGHETIAVHGNVNRWPSVTIGRQLLRSYPVFRNSGLGNS